MNRLTLSTIFSIASGLIMLASAISYTAIGISGVNEHFATGESFYWQNRLLASQLTGTTAFALAGVVTLLAAHFRRSHDAEVYKAGTWFLAVSALPAVSSVMALLILTPQDAAHAIPFALAVFCSLASLVLGKNNSA